MLQGPIHGGLGGLVWMHRHYHKTALHQRLAETLSISITECVAGLQGLVTHRGRLTELPPPYARTQQELQKVAGAPNK